MDVIVRNFQSIVEAKLRLEGFTILIGESSAGKSSILKALYAATHNRFKIGQVRNGEEFSEIKIRVPEDERVLTVRRHPQGSPAIKLGDKVYSKLSRSVPTDVEEFCNFGYLVVADEKYSLNFRSQFDKPLLLEYSQKKVMEILSASQAIDDLNKVHYALSKKREQNRGAFNNVDTILTENNATLSMLKYEISQTEGTSNALRQEIKFLEDNVATADMLAELQSKIKTAKLTARKCELLQSRVDAVKQQSVLSNHLAELSTLQTSLKEVKRCTRQMEIRRKLVEVISQLDYEKVESLKVLQSKINQLNLIQQSPKKETLNVRIDLLKKIVTLSREISNKKATLGALEALGANIKLHSTQVDRIAQLNHIVLDNICPICGNSMSNHKH